MKITKIYEPQSTDGYTSSGDGIYFASESDAEMYSKKEHRAYSAGAAAINTIEDNGKFYRLESSKPVTLYGSNEFKEELAKSALAKLSKEEIEAIKQYQAK